MKKRLSTVSITFVIVEALQIAVLVLTASTHGFHHWFVYWSLLLAVILPILFIRYIVKRKYDVKGDKGKRNRSAWWFR